MIGLLASRPKIAANVECAIIIPLQALLLVCQMVLFYWYCLSLFWSGTTGATAKTHLRVILLLKSITFAFSALQLRSGYPSPASYR